MAGTREGGLKVRAKLLAADPDHYKKAGRNGGLKSRGGGFAYMAATDPARLSKIGQKGGSISRRGPARKTVAR